MDEIQRPLAKRNAGNNKKKKREKNQCAFFLFIYSFFSKLAARACLCFES